MSFEVLPSKGVCAPDGFKAAGVEAGIKAKGGLDLALIVSDVDATVAGAFTTNAAAAPQVRMDRERVAMGTARGVVVNSGCANSFTGKQGYEDALAMAAAAADSVGASPESFLACSTGHIGSFLPMEKIKAGIQKAAAALSRDDDVPARAIMTTDTRPKKFAAKHPSGFAVGGMAKGAGMISPAMAVAHATMLAFITTDAEAEASLLRAVLGEAVDQSFNRVIVDGDRSTCDTVLVFANGASGVRPTEQDLAMAINAACRSLAEAIAADGEGSTKLASVVVRGAATPSEAERAARQVASSLLVKTMLYGADANWGRIAAALGQSKVSADFDRISVSVGGFELLSEGVAASDSVVEDARTYMKANRRIDIVCDLYAGTSEWEILTSDISPEYVEFNAEYEV